MSRLNTAYTVDLCPDRYIYVCGGRGYILGVKGKN